MHTQRIGIIGLGYVGLPLAVEFGKKFPVTGFDIKKERVNELIQGHDNTLEVEDDLLKSVLIDKNGQTGLFLTDQLDDIRQCNYYIVTVPTPIDRYKRPDLTPVVKATETISKVIKKDDIIIYESTVYPGCTEEVCVPILEKGSGLRFNKDFFCGFSPERINPGDKVHTVTKIKKITSGSTPEIGQKVDALYRTIITAGTFLVSSLKVAEAAKVIENTQRDLNIAFVNELAKLFNMMNIDTKEVLEAAGTKWNFLHFQPGLVGGHCIGVDPYYLTHKAQEIGYHPEVILAGRRINDSMGSYVAEQVVKLMIKKGQTIHASRVLILGVTFKENCPDVRNSRVIDIVTELQQYRCQVDVYDPWADPKEVKHEYGVELISDFDMKLKNNKIPHYDAIVLAVAHDVFKSLDLASLKNGNAIVYDVKGILKEYDGRL
ncbi:MAG: nucleotide sugar dehydrogenase [Candidatus Marinimicrobia bacterium]|jgi:UDP-N-acetyl-D-galactosamine dehydrogenase|nr:nucleotide sugar dehydrogenase [Candidatus Neomarinimicrobiota bacterium]MCK9484189.1 nucleotide sugar dehydrogenase [Candidatus Neomarinimicrobiota bacterium]MCK9560831.1 nucleotide sugar dehydrogenase [Candidatus Neomarinimicrobiota bacterium]